MMPAATTIVDLGAEDAGDASAVDFSFDDADASVDLDATAESPTIEQDPMEKTAEMPAIEDQFDVLDDGTSELPSLDEDLGEAISASGQDAEETAEINLDELDLDIDSNAETELASLDDLDDTGVNEALDEGSITGKNPEIDPNSTGVREALDTGANRYRRGTRSWRP